MATTTLDAKKTATLQRVDLRKVGQLAPAFSERSINAGSYAGVFSFEATNQLKAISRFKERRAAYDRAVPNTGSTNYCTGLSILLKILPTHMGDLGTLNEDYSSNGVDYTSGACLGPDMAGLVQDAADLKAV